MRERLQGERIREIGERTSGVAREAKIAKRRRFEDEGENSGTKGESKFTEEERGEMHGKVSREEEEGGEGVVDLACVFIQ